jgi:ABC-type sulfate/molybdate transport systems ATPase subunit
VLFSTHDAAEAHRRAPRTLVLAAGRLIYDGPPEALLSRPGEPPAEDFEHALVRFLAAHGEAEEAAA